MVSRIPNVDIAIVTALREELEPMLQLFGGTEVCKKVLIEKFEHYYGTLTHDGVSIKIIATFADKYGSDSITAAVMRLKETKPKLLIMIGICAAWDKKGIVLGDVIVADRAYHADEGKRKRNDFLTDIETYQPEPWLSQWLKNFTDASWANNIKTKHPKATNDLVASSSNSAKPNIWYGSIASTSYVVEDENFFPEQSKKNRKVIAADMETAAFYKAAGMIGVPAFAVKGVSDYGKPPKEDSFHAYASEVSARWVYAFLCDHIGDISKIYKSQQKSGKTNIRRQKGSLRGKIEHGLIDLSVLDVKSLQGSFRAYAECIVNDYTNFAVMCLPL